MGDGYLGKCKECTKWDNKVSNGTQKRVCVICSKEFRTTLSEVKRGGGNCCSVACWRIRFAGIPHEFKGVVKRGEMSPSWIGDEVGYGGLHSWVKKNLGKQSLCEHCGDTEQKKYEWSNKDHKYRRNLDDWQRLCSKCHRKYDMEVLGIKFGNYERTPEIRARISKKLKGKPITYVRKKKLVNNL